MEVGLCAVILPGDNHDCARPAAQGIVDCVFLIFCTPAKVCSCSPLFAGDANDDCVVDKCCGGQVLWCWLVALLGIELIST
jgi:hypothetical protein